MAANQFALAFVELLDANDELCGSPQFIMIKGRKHRAIIEEISVEEIMVAGGKADAGGFRCQVPTSGFSEDPAKGDTAQKLGKGPEMEILSFSKTNDAVYIITTGDPAAEE